MFLRFYKFRKTFFTSPASRIATKYVNTLNIKLNIRSLVVKKKWNAGRNDSGRVVMRARTSLLRKNRYFSINKHLRNLRLGFLSSFQFIPFKNKLLSLVFFSNGAITYFITSEFHRLFSFFFFNSTKRMRRVKIRNTFLILFQIKKLTFVSFLEILPGRGAQYALSSGVKARIIKFDTPTRSAMIQLPSGLKKIFSYYSFCMLGRIALYSNKNYLNGKAGYWRSFGIKPTVRGVAMNPVDHPHGGRTKSVRYPRTPWGKTTKFK